MIKLIEGEHGYCPKCSGGLLGKSGINTRKFGTKKEYKCASCGYRSVNPTPNPTNTDDVIMRQDITKSKYYFITAAQNATPTLNGMIPSAEQWAKKCGGEILVIPIRHRNADSVHLTEDREDDWWDKETLPYLFNGRQNIGSITILGDIKVLPTAVTPLTGLDSITGSQSGIVGHTKIQLTTVATPNNKLPKIMTTTGACTIQNYTESKAGKKGEFHHAYGACIVEVKGKTFHLRQVSVMPDGSFIDLDKEYTPKGVKKAPPAEALIMGDTHVDFADPAVIKATFGDGGIVKTLKPKRLIYHDLLDFYSRNHHHRGDPFAGIAKQQSGKDDVRGEIDRAIAFVTKYTPKNTEAIIVASNHNDALSRWINESDWRSDPVNAEVYLETALAMVQSVKMTKNGKYVVHPFTYWGNKAWGDSVRMLGRNESYMVKDIELSLHGDKGANGSRGSVMGISKIGVKTVIGHSHSPGIRDGCYQTGTSTYLQLEYNSGPSGWVQSHVVIYGNGKRSIISIIDGAWKL